VDAEKKALKLNPFLWKSYESLCNLGEFRLEPQTVFDLEAVDSLQDCHGANPLVNFINSYSEGPAAEQQQQQQQQPVFNNLSRIFQTPQQQTPCQASFLYTSCVRGSVADPDPGSGAFLPPGSGIRIRDKFFPYPGFRIQRVCFLVRFS
jgi:hypothetical protein